MTVFSNSVALNGGRVRRCFIALLVLATAGITPGYATPYPDAGRLYREYNDAAFRKPLPRLVDTLPEVAAPVTSVDQSGELVLVRGFEVHGDTRLGDEAIHSVLAPWVDRELGQLGFQEAAAALMAAYRAAGLFAARVYVPPQAIVDGVVQLYIYEGYLEDDGIAFVNSGKRVRDESVQSILEANLTAGELLTAREFERAILLVNDLAGLSSHSTLYPGEEVGSAGFLMQTEDTGLISGNLDVDNFGSYYTGEARIGATLYVNSPARRGDQLTARLVTSGSDSNYGYLSYTMPLTGKGLRVGASVDFLEYDLGKQFSFLGSEGNAFGLRAFASYPFIRSRHLNTIGQFEYEHLELEDRDDVGLLADRTIDSGIFSVIGDHDDDFMADGVTYYSLAVTLGDVGINGNQAFQDFDSANVMTEGGFAKLNFGLSRLQHIGGNWSTFLSLNGQYSSQNLDSSQKFFIGGPFSVAGYPVGEASGDHGAVFQADLRYDFYDVPWRGNLQASAFYSYGTVKLFHETWPNWQGGNTNLKNHIDLQSVGLAVTQTWSYNFMLRGLLGWQVGSNAAANPITGEASDGSDDDYRVWLQGVYYF